MRRVGVSVLAILRATNIWLCTFWIALLYPLGLADEPTGRMFTSVYVGRALHNGHRWAVRVAAVIDWLAVHIGGDRPDHCLRSYMHYRAED